MSMLCMAASDRGESRARHSFVERLGHIFCRGEDGQSLVEFAVTLPVLLLVVTGLMTFGIAINNYILLTDGVNIGARQLAISRGNTTDPCYTVSSAVIAAAPLLKPASMTFKFVLNGTAYTGTSCIRAAAPRPERPANWCRVPQRRSR